ncbi:DapH/DapD/GlmU-related protein [Serratia sp. CY31527]|uniref:DapH/DapD/GlmU-related protein n=1 Tax=Serratia sp. CY31527 TaxID=3383597 RepID=UPI003F9F2D48
MLFFYTSSFCKNIKISRARAIINSRLLSNKIINTLLKKSGVLFDGDSVITPPFFYEFGKIKLGSNVYINASCNFLDNANISIGEDSLIGPNVTLTTANHIVDPALRHAEVITAPITIGKNVWIGAGVVVLPGIHIGDNSVIAANSVVTSNVPANSLFAGSPAKSKREI